MEDPHASVPVNDPDRDMVSGMKTQRVTSYVWLAAVNNFNAQYSTPVLVVVGVAGNLLALAVFLCSPLRRITTSVYLAGQSLTDLLFLTFLGINWLASIQIDVFALPGLCQTLVYVTYVVSFLSLWMIVALTFDLYSSIKWHCVHRRISRPTRAICISAGLVVVGCVIYAFSFWLTQRVDQPNKQTLCLHNGHASLAITGAVIDSALTLVVPFCLLIYMNVRILYVIASLSKSRSKFEPEKPRRQPVKSSIRARMRRSVTSSQAAELRGARSQTSRRKSHAISLLSTTSSGSERFPRKRVSFEDENRILMDVKEDTSSTVNDAIRKCIVIAEVVVTKEQLGTRRNSYSVTALLPVDDCLRVQRRSTMSEKQKSHINGLHRERASFPTRLSGITAPSRRASLVKDSSNSSAYKNRSRFQNKLKRRRSTISSDTADTGTLKRPRAVGKQRDSLRRRLVNTPGKKNRKQPRRPSPLTKLQSRCFRMVLTVAIVFLCLNVPSHTIRLQSLVHSLLDSNYRPSELEIHLQQFLQFFYYLNFVVNVFIFSACTKNFRTACIDIPWHMAATLRHLRDTCISKRAPADLAQTDTLRKNASENSRHVEICLHEIDLLEMPPTKKKPVSPPCLISVDPHPREKPHSVAAH